MHYWQLSVITCMDSRLMVAKMLGLDLGDIGELCGELDYSCWGVGGAFKAAWIAEAKCWSDGECGVITTLADNAVIASHCGSGRYGAEGPCISLCGVSPTSNACRHCLGEPPGWQPIGSVNAHCTSH
jgi:hypothetical protein